MTLQSVVQRFSVGVPSKERPVALLLSCHCVRLPRTTVEVPWISAHPRVRPPQHCKSPPRVQTWNTEKACGAFLSPCASVHNSRASAHNCRSRVCLCLLLAEGVVRHVACVSLASLIYQPSCCVVLALNLHLTSRCHHCQQLNVISSRVPGINNHLLQILLVALGLIAIRCSGV